MELSEITPVLWNLSSLTVTALALPAVKETSKTGTLAAALDPLEMSEPADGLPEDNIAASPDAGAIGDGVGDGVGEGDGNGVGAGVGETAIEFTKAPLFGPK